MILQKTTGPAIGADAGEHGVELLQAGRGGDLPDLQHPPHVVGEPGELERVADRLAVEIGQGAFAAPSATLWSSAPDRGEMPSVSWANSAIASPMT